MKAKKDKSKKEKPGKAFDADRKLRRKEVWIGADFNGVESETVEVRPGDLIEWRSRSAQRSFYVRFKEGRGKSPDANDQRVLIAHEGVVRMVARELGRGEKRPECEYEIVGEAGTIDPRIIIDPQAP